MKNCKSPVSSLELAWARRRTIGLHVAADLGAEFVAKLGIAADEAGESVMWLMLIVQNAIRNDEHTKELLGEGREITAILSKSHKTAKENRRRKSKNQLTKLPTNPFTKSI